MGDEFGDLAEDELTDLEQAEAYDGIRFSWNVFPSTSLNARKLFIPLGCLYTPLQRAEDMERVEYDCVQCSNPKCSAVLNPFCDLETVQQMWECVMCGNRNPFPHSFSHVSSDNLPCELQADFPTIEYMAPQDPNYSPSILFVVDTCLIEEELTGLCSSIQQVISDIPEEIKDSMYFGIITFGRHVSLHEIGFGECNKIHVFRGDSDEGKHPDVDKVKGQLGVTHEDVGRFMIPLSQCEDILVDILGSLKRDSWPQASCERAKRCTGAAIQVGVSLMESLCQGHSARVMVFSGGACSCGPGQVIPASLEHHIRSHQDILNGKAPFYENAKLFYKTIANRAAQNSHVVDMFNCCLDQTGVAEQRVLVDNTGGILILSDTFTTLGFSDSFQRIFDVNKHGELSMSFCGDIQIVASPEIKVCGCIGPVTSMGENSSCVSASSVVGIGKTSKWNLGGMNPTLTLSFYLEVSNTDVKKLAEKFGYIQFITKYRDSNGYNITRTSTFAVPFKNSSTTNGFNEIKGGFDEEAAAVMLGRLGVFKAENEYDLNIINWLDRVLIKSMAKVAKYQPDCPESFEIPPEFRFFPQFMFYLRRSKFVRVFGHSPDESAYFRHWLTKSSLLDSMTMIQPTLTSYNLEDEDAQAVLLDAKSRQEDVILLLDTFFYVVKWAGKSVAEWRDDNLREDPEYGYIGDFLDKAELERVTKCKHRFPYPTEIQCDHGTSQERFLLARLNPSVKNSKGGQQNGVWTDDVNLESFMYHLKKLASMSAN